MDNINSYIIINKKTSFVINLFIITSILIIISLIVLSQFKYKKYYYTYGHVISNSDKYQLALYLSPYQLNIIKNTNNLKIDKIDYNYKIDNITSEYIITSDCNNCLMVVLDVNLKKKDRIVNNILDVQFLESDKKIFYYLKDYLTKGEN